jgi:predicted transcriptional regulator
MNWIYTSIQHGPRLELGISPNEYCVLDVYYQTQSSPKYSVDGWSENSYKQISDFLGFSKGTVHKMVDRFVQSGLMEVNAANPKQKKTTESWYSIAYDRVQKVNDKKLAVQKVNDAVQKVNASRSKSERHIVEIEVKRELKEMPTPATAAPDPSDSFIARHSAPKSDPDHFGNSGLTAFEGGTENDYESVYGRIAEHLNGSADWKGIAGLAKCTMSGEEFKEELQAWIRHFVNKQHLYKKPVQSLRGGPISFINWLRKPWAQDKYNPATKAKQIQSRKGGPVRRTITTA